MLDRLTVLQDPTLPAEKIEELWRTGKASYPYDNDPYVGAIVAHPNCPPWLFWELMRFVPLAAGQNPALALLLLEADGMAHHDPWHLLHLLRKTEVPLALVEVLARHPVKSVRSAARHHVSLADEAEGDWEEALIDVLASELHRDRHLVWLARVGALPERLNTAFPHPYRPTPLPPRRACVATPRQDEWESYWEHNTRLGKQVIEQGLELPERERRRAVIAFLAASEGELVRVLALAQVSGRTLICRKTVSPNWHYRLGSVLNFRLPKASLERLTDDGNRWVRAVAQKRLADSKWRLFS